MSFIDAATAARNSPESCAHPAALSSPALPARAEYTGTTSIPAAASNTSSAPPTPVFNPRCASISAPRCTPKYE